MVLCLRLGRSWRARLNVQCGQNVVLNCVWMGGLRAACIRIELNISCWGSGSLGRVSGPSLAFVRVLHCALAADMTAASLIAALRNGA